MSIFLQGVAPVSLLSVVTGLRFLMIPVLVETEVIMVALPVGLRRLCHSVGCVICLTCEEHGGGCDYCWLLCAPL